MQLLPDDPKLTAYALGELTGADRAEVEAALQHSPECRQAVEEIRQFAGALTKELKGEPCPTLSEAQRATVLSGATALPAATEASPATKVIPFPRRTAYLATAAALAACLAVAMIWQFGLARQSKPAYAGREYAQAVDPSPELKLVAKRSENDVKTLPEDRAKVAGTAPANPVITDLKLIADGDKELKLSLKPVDELARLAVKNPEPKDNLNLDVVQLSVTSEGSLVAGGDLAKPALQAGSSEKSQTANGYATYSLTPEVRKPGTGGKDGSERKLNESLATLGDASGKGTTLYRYDSLGASPARKTQAPPPPVSTLSSDPKSGTIIVAFEKLEAAEAAASRSGSTTARPVSEAQVAQQKRELERLSQLVKPAHPTYREAEKKLADLQSEQARYRFVQTPEPTTTAAYPRYYENPFVPVTEQPLSTFSIDVDTASYANVRRFLNANRLPPSDAVRIEEMVNYFTYNYPAPKGNDPFSASLESATCPWNGEHRLLRVALKGREMAREKRPASNFVFLIDVSGSMQPQERLPLIKQGLRMLVKKMNAADRVAIVVYASSSGLVLESTSCENKETILAAIDRLEAGGSTNGGEGIQRAYDVASQNFIKSGINRVILCTDGDFNVGITDQGQLLNLIQAKAKSGVFLTTLGVGTDNLKDALMQRLADKGNGNYHYLDSVEEAHKVLVEQMNGTLVTIAKDVKIQIEFNPAHVQSYRLIGYEKRMLQNKDFNDDTKDAGEIGAGHTVTALYEIVPVGSVIRPVSNDLKYQPTVKPEPPVRIANASPEMLTLKLRFKQPEGNESKLLEFPYTSDNHTYRRASSDFKFATAVASFGMILRNSEYKAGANLDTVLELAEESKGTDEQGYRAEFINLVKKAKALGR
jgi:Ca-activated chloride channel family protein